MEQPKHQNDVYISHCDADSEWVEEWLLPSLEAEGFSVTVNFRDFVLGMPTIENTEQAVANSYRTIVVITPDWLASKWNKFEEILVRTNDPDASKRKLLPLLLKETELKGSLAALNTANFTNKSRWKKQLKRVIRDLRDHVPPSKPDPSASKFSYFKHWLRYYRQPLRLGLLVTTGAVVGLLTMFEIPPFQQRMGWQVVSPALTDTLRLHLNNGTLLVTSKVNTNRIDTSDDTGLWRKNFKGNNDDGAAIEIKALKFFEGGSNTLISRIHAFASSPQNPERIYAITKFVGLLKSDDDGKTWKKIGATLPKNLKHIAVLQAPPYTMFLNARGFGLFKSSTEGNQWEKISGQSECDTNNKKGALPEDFVIGTMITNDKALIVGSYQETNSGYPNEFAGLYMSKDEGKCWEKIDSADRKYQYKKIVRVGKSQNDFLVLTYDHSAKQMEPKHYLWLMNTETGRRLKPILKTRGVVRAIYANESYWYSEGGFGGLIRGSLSTSNKAIQSLPVIPRCLFPLHCLYDFAGNSNHDPPFLLAKGRVYRLQLIPWYQRLWP